VQRYWSFMLEEPQMYRLMNGMDGVPIDREKVGSLARGSFGAAKAALQAWFVAEGAAIAEVDALMLRPRTRTSVGPCADAVRMCCDLRNLLPGISVLAFRTE
jgi:hypothetical protein